MDFDLAIVGAGTTGCAIARHLSRFDLKIALVDAAEDVAAGASRANSAIVHAGFDAKPGSLMAGRIERRAGPAPRLRRRGARP